MDNQEAVCLCCKCGSPHVYLLSLCAYHKYCKNCFEIVYSNPETLSCIQCQFIAKPRFAGRVTATGVCVGTVAEGLGHRDSEVLVQHRGSNIRQNSDSLNLLHSYDHLERPNFNRQCSQDLAAYGGEKQFASAETRQPWFTHSPKSESSGSDHRESARNATNAEFPSLHWSLEFYSKLQKQLEENSGTSSLPAQHPQQHIVNFNDVADLHSSPLVENTTKLLLPPPPPVIVSSQPPNLLQYSCLSELPKPSTLTGLSNIQPTDPMSFHNSNIPEWPLPQLLLSSLSLGGPSHFWRSCNSQPPIGAITPSDSASQFCSRHVLQRATLNCRKCSSSRFCHKCIDLHQAHLDSVFVLKEDDRLRQQSELISQMLQREERMKKLETTMKGLQLVGHTSAWEVNPDMVHRMGASKGNGKAIPLLSYDNITTSSTPSSCSNSHLPAEMDILPGHKNILNPDPSKCKLVAGLRIRSHLEASFFVDICDRLGRPTGWSGNSLSVEISLRASNHLVPYNIQDHPERPGLFKVNYQLATNGCYKVTVKILNIEISNSPLIFNYPSPKVIGAIGLREALDGGDGFLERPWGVTVHGSHVIVADRTSCTVQIFSKDGKFVKKIGKRSEASSRADSLCEFYRPSGIAIDSQGRFIITDKDNHRIKVYNKSCDFLRQFGEKGRSIGQFDYPFGVAVNEKDEIFIADSKNDRIVSYSSDLIFLRKTYSGSKFVKNPRDVACYGSYVIASLFDNGELVVFDQCLLVSLLKIGSSYLGRPQGIDIDVDGDIIVVESTRYSPIEPVNTRYHAKYKTSSRRSKEPRISVFKTDIRKQRNVVGGPKLTAELNYSFTSTECDEYGALNEPCGVHITEKGEIFVVDSLNHRVLIWM